MIHSGAIVGAGLPQFQSITFKKINFDFPYFRSDRYSSILCKVLIVQLFIIIS